MMLQLSNSAKTIAVIYLIIALVSTQIPLINYLGFEFSFLFAILASLAGGWYTVHVLRARNITRGVFVSVLLINLLLLVVPLAVMLTNAFFVKNCSLVEGFGFFVLLPVVSVWIATSVAFFCTVHYRHPFLVFLGFVAITFSYAVALGYFTPAIHSYNFFYGFFPGLTYDEALGITWTLLLFRLWSVGVGGIFLWMGILLVRDTHLEDSTVSKGVAVLSAMFSGRRLPLTIIIVATGFSVWWFRGSLGFESPARFIQEYLGGVYETERMKIYYSPDSYTGEEIRLAGAEHEFRLQQVMDALSLQTVGRIESYIYPSNEVKQRLIGTSTTNIAKPWSGQIHVTKQSLDATLKHELVHVLAARFGKPIIGASLSTGLVEGLAMAIEWSWGNRTLHQYAAAMRRYDVAPDLKNILHFTGFATHSSSISYVLAGSFCRFLIDRYGIRSMMLLYRDGNYEAVYKRPVGSLIAEWNIFLDGVELHENDRDAVDVLFRRPAIFDKVCARVIARRNIEARRLAAEKEYRAAAALFHQSYEDGNGFDAFSGYLNASVRGGEFDAARTALDSVILCDQNPNQYLPLFITIGDAYWAGGDGPGAYDLYARVRRADFSAAYTEAALVRMHALGDTVHADRYMRYFLSDDVDSVRLRLLDSIGTRARTAWLVHYLKGKALLRPERSADAVAVLQMSPAGDSLLEAMRLNTVGLALFKQGEYQQAKMYFWNSLNFVSTEVAEAAVYDWIERCEWMERYPHKGTLRN